MDEDKKVRKEIDTLVRDLGIENKTINDSAVEKLVKIGKPAISTLIKALRSCNSQRSKNAASVLGKIRNDSAVPALVESLNNENCEIRIAVVWALGEIRNVGAVPSLIELLKNEKDVFMRAHIVCALKNIGDFSAIPALIKILEQDDPYVAKFAAEALGSFRDASAVPALINALKHYSWDVRFYAAEALGNIKDPSAVPALMDASKNDEEAYVREKAARGLGVIRDLRAIPALIDALKDKEEDVRTKAANALGEIGEPAFEDVIKAYLKGELTYEQAELVFMEFNNRLQSENFDKGTVAPPKKKPDRLESAWFRKPSRLKTQNTKPNLRRGVVYA